MFNEWVVSIKSGYDENTFSFSNSEEAVMFAKMAIMAIQNDTNSKGEEMASRVTISAIAETTIKKEDSNNGMELSEG